MNKDEEKTYLDIKNELLNNEIYKKVKDYSKNRYDLMTYYNVGKMLVEAGKHYGEGIIKKYSERLTYDLGKKYSVTSLKYMRQYYIYQKSQPLADQLSWSHYQELLPLKNTEIINYYIHQIIIHNLSKRQLRERIKSKEYERLPIETRNKLINQEHINITDLVKDPIIIKNNTDKEINSEKMLQQLILDNIERFMHQLGDGFMFVGSEYKIRIDNTFNYIDILLYNINYSCYVVVELKTTNIKKEHVGQALAYMSIIDDTLKKDNQNDTIGIIIGKENNKYIIKLCAKNNIKITKYIII